MTGQYCEWNAEYRHTSYLCWPDGCYGQCQNVNSHFDRLRTIGRNWRDIAVQRFAVDVHRTLAGMLHGDVVGHAAERTRHGQLVEPFWRMRFDGQAVEPRTYVQQILRNC